MKYRRIKDLREDYDWTQQYVADHLHISRSTYSNYENEIRDIPIEILIRLAKLYHVSLDYLVGLSDKR